MADYLCVRTSQEELLRKIFDLVGDDVWVLQTTCWTLRRFQPAPPACRCFKCNQPRTESLAGQMCRAHRFPIKGKPCIDCDSKSEYGHCSHRYAAQAWTAVNSVERYLWTRDSLGWPQDLTVQAAAALGQLDVFRLAFTPLPDFCVCNTVFMVAAMGGHVDIIQHAIDNGCEWDFDSVHTVCGAAAQCGHVAVIDLAFRSGGDEWNAENSPRMAHCISRGIGQGGHLEMLEWAQRHNLVDPLTCVRAAAGENRQQVINRLIGANLVKMQRDTSICEAAAGGGHLDLLQKLRCRGFVWDVSTCTAAARGGHLPVLQYARAERCPWRDSVLAEAAGTADVKMLEWMCANGCHKDPEACTVAGSTGRLDNLQFLRSVDVKWSSVVCHRAALNNHLRVLQWAYANGCPWRYKDRVKLMDNKRISKEIHEWIRALPMTECLRKRKRID